MSKVIIRRKRLTLPLDLRSEPAICQSLDLAEQALADLAPPSHFLLERVSGGKVPELWHPLCEHMPDTTRFPPKPQRDIHERTLFDEIQSNLSFSSKPEQFTNVLKAANRLLPGCDGEFRTRDVGLSPDGRDIQVLFPESDGTTTQLVDLHHRLNAEGPTLANAILALAGLLNCHPFSDGNGRVARALFAVILVRSGACGRFPLHLFAHPCRMSFDLCLREAEVRDDWKPLVLHICSIIVICAGQNTSQTIY